MCNQRCDFFAGDKLPVYPWMRNFPLWFPKVKKKKTSWQTSLDCVTFSAEGSWKAEDSLFQKKLCTFEAFQVGVWRSTFGLEVSSLQAASRSLRSIVQSGGGGLALWKKQLRGFFSLLQSPSALPILSLLSLLRQRWPSASLLSLAKSLSLGSHSPNPSSSPHRRWSRSSSSSSSSWREIKIQRECPLCSPLTTMTFWPRERMAIH